MNAAQQRPDACACKCGDQSIDYGSLDNDSGKLARFLVEQGATPGDRIGVFMPRCVESIVAVYAVFKAGCIFVPIDPNLTAGGVEALVRDCGIRLLLTHPNKDRVTGKLLQADTGLECVIGGGESVVTGDLRQHFNRQRLFNWDCFADTPLNDHNQSKISVDDPAYIMYSSGSTGQPKGITHTHFSGMSYSRLSIETYNVSSHDIIANHSPISFDMSTFGYFTSFLAGATTILIPEAHTKFPSSLAKLIEAERITIWYSVPLALIQMLTRTRLESFDMSCIRWVKYGGEPFPPKHLKALMRCWPKARFSNVYGPAEVNQCTYYHLPGNYVDNRSDDPIPIGTVWNQTAGMIIDENDGIVSEGDVGELVVNSTTMMKGYWGRPDRNARAFWNHVTEDGLDRAYYRTGDLVQRLPDGNLILHGRKDRQVKVRGYRVELDEVENALNGIEEVMEAGVYCVNMNESREIRAAVIPNELSCVDADYIRTRLADVLSFYSIPTTISLVDHLPRTTSGKIDRRRLATNAESAANQ